MRRVTLLGILIFMLAAPSHATRGGENYPKVLAYSSGINLLPPATQDSLSWYDVLVCMDRPETISSLRVRNPEQKYLWDILPQYALPFEDPDPWWMPDTLWSVRRLMCVYAHENDWYLRDTAGEPIIHWGRHVLNWTEHCPVGTFGSSKGLRVAEWLASVALPTIALSGRGMDPWHWDSRTSYNGYMFEILADCFGADGNSTFADADPDRDGEAEGVYNLCSLGGSDDPLSVLFRAENEIFYQRLMLAFPQEFVFLINENNEYIGPWWVTKLSGMKFENWMRSASNPSWHTWWDWFYGLTPPWAPGENWGAGYAWTESEFDKPVADSLKGWDLSFIQTWEERGESESANMRQMRWGLGTSMLGDGYFCYTYDQKYPLWQTEFDWDFGEPMEDFRREIYGLGDTLYVRFFEEGMVEVNPNDTSVNYVPSHDSRFSFWLTVDDLWANPVGTKTAQVGWTAPTGHHNQADSYELRYATSEITLEDWESATSYAGNPIIASPGTAVARTVDDLLPGQTYRFAVRTRISGRLEPFISNVEEVTLGGTADTIPPGVIDDLTLEGSGETWLDLTWTATGDDGLLGLASSYAMRFLVDEEIASEDDWDRATPATGLPSPRLAGALESYQLSGLEPGQTYGIAVRALDDQSNISPLHLPFSATTVPVPVDSIPPGMILDLDSIGSDETWLDLSWTATGDDGTEGIASSYLLRFLDNEPISTEEDWDRAEPAYNLPPPHGSGMPELYRLSDLEPDTRYGIAVRASDEEGNLSPLHPEFFGTTLPVPPDTIPPDPIAGLSLSDAGTSWLDLTWIASGDDGTTGTAAAYALRYLPGQTIETEEDWNRSTSPGSIPPPQPPGSPESYTLDGLDPDQTYGIAVRAIDDEGNISDLHSPFSASTLPVPPPDDTPPSGINDLAGAPADPGVVALTWSAPGDDGWEGSASGYLIRILAGSAIETEADWNDAEQAPVDPPLPAPPHTIQTLDIGGLEPSAHYGVAVRAYDEVDNLGDLSNPLLVQAGEEELPPQDRDSIPPGAIDDLIVTETEARFATFSWTATGDDGDEGVATVYELRLAAGHPIEDEDDWSLATVPDSIDLPPPAQPGTQQEVTVYGLLPGYTYGVALRARDEVENQGPLSPPLTFETTSEVPIDTVPPEPILDLRAYDADTTTIRLIWSAPSDSGGAGQAADYHLHFAPDGTDDDAIWEVGLPVDGLPPPGIPGELDSVSVSGLLPGERYGFVLRSVDYAGNLSDDSNVVWAETDTILIDHPPSAIVDLKLVEAGADTARLSWTAPDDGNSGDVEKYHVRLRTDGPISTEEEWELAFLPDTTGLGRPAGAGIEEEWTLINLEASTTYSIAIRAEDAGGNIGPLSNATSWATTTMPPKAVPGPVIDLTGVADSDTSCELSWVSPANDPERAEPFRYRLGYTIGEIPIETEEDWELAIERSEGLPDPAPAGTPQSHRLLGLLPETTYAIALRAEDDAGRLGLIGASVLITTAAADTGDTIDPPDPPDLPPAAPVDFAAIATGPTWIEFAWTAVGEDSLLGRASAYEMRLLAGEPFDDEYDWELASPIEQTLSPPDSSGAGESFRLEGLDAGSGYGVALRVYDAAGQISPWIGGIYVELPEEPIPPPAAIEQFEVAAIDPTSVTLRWTHPGDPESEDGPNRFVVGIASEQIDEENWPQTEKHPDPPEPAAAGVPVEMRWDGLASATTYWLAVMTYGHTGETSPLSESLVFTTPPLDVAPPEPPARVRIDATDEAGWVSLSWDRSPSSDVAGYNIFGSDRSNAWSQLNESLIPVSVTSATVEATSIAFAVTAIDGAGNESDLSGQVELFADRLDLLGPFPHPVTESCRFVIEWPIDRVPGSIQMRVHDLSGRTIRTLIEGAPWSIGSLEVVWDRTDSHGRIVAPGFYLVSLEISGRSLHRRVFVSP